MSHQMLAPFIGQQFQSVLRSDGGSALNHLSTCKNFLVAAIDQFRSGKLCRATGFVRAAKRVSEVRGDGDRICVFVGVPKTRHLFAYPRVHRLTAKYTDQTVGRCKDIFPNLEYLHGSQRCKTKLGLVIATPQLKFIASVTGVLGLLEDAIPDFVGILDIDLQVWRKLLSNLRCEFSHVVVISPMRHAKPRIAFQSVAKLDHVFKRNTAIRLRRVS